MSIYKRYPDKTKSMCFMIKDEKIFYKYMTIWEKVNNTIKNNNSEFIYNKIYLKAEKIVNKKESLQCLYIAVILFDSVYKKRENYYPKKFLEKFIHNIFWRNIRNFYFWGFRSSSGNIRKFCFIKYNEVFPSFRFPKYEKKMRVVAVF